MTYSIIGFIAIIINLIINRDAMRGGLVCCTTPAKKAYLLFDYAILTYHITDALWGICDATGSQMLLYVDTIVYYIAMYGAVYFWARYVVAYLNENSRFDNILLIAGDILLVLEIIALFVNHWHHFFFWVDDAGNYHAYVFRYLALIVQILLFLVTAFRAFHRCRLAGNAPVAIRYRAIGAFGIAMSIAIIVQIIYPLLPIYSIGYMIGTCLIHTHVIENENAELRRKADAANNAKTAFLFNMSHDIRTPMNAILGYTDIALRHVDEKELVNDSLGKIKSSGIHLLNLINDILEMSRIESGNLQLAENPTDIRTACAGIETMSRSLAEKKDIDFEMIMGEITDPYVYADELHINEVVINLISNAIKYTPAGGRVRYTVEQATKPENGRAFYRMTVSDTGIGMSETFQTHLFETFSREQTSTVTKTEGAGLGLSIVKRIVDIAGGTITVTSAPGEGSTFSVELPFRVMGEQAVETLKKHTAPVEPLTRNPELAGKRVLIVEDNEMNREIAVDLLEDAGLKTEAAEDGKLAVELVKRKGVGYYDLILMDIQMPVMDGMQATREIRRLPGSEKLPIIALSANAFDEDKKRSIACGMNEHIAKPVDSRQLIEAIRRLLK